MKEDYKKMFKKLTNKTCPMSEPCGNCPLIYNCPAAVLLKTAKKK